MTLLNNEIFSIFYNKQGENLFKNSENTIKIHIEL